MLAIVHTSYSLQTGVRNPQDWVRAALARGYSALAVADINGLFGAVHFARAAIAAGIRPLIGTLLLWPPRHACTVLATSTAGYRQLCRLLTARHLDSHFDLAVAAAAGGVDELLFLVRSDATLQELVACVPRGNLFALPRSPQATVAAVPLAATPIPRLPMAPVPDAWFIDETDREPFSLLCGIRRLAGPDLLPGLAETPGALLPVAADWLTAYPEQQITQALLERCAFAFEFGRPLFPRISLPAGASAAEHLQHLCTQELRHRYRGEHARRAGIRLQLELDVICAKGFADYFLYVREIVAFAQESGIPVEIRGSAASSIVSYLLGFTHCCPLAHDLYFERFLNPGRQDCPDIDIDIADNRRDEVVAFCYRRWGAGQVAMLATVTTYRLAGALWDVARWQRLPLDRVRELGRNRWQEQHPFGLHDYLTREGIGNPWEFPPPATPAPQPGDAMLGELRPLARRLLGLPRHLGVHCGGLLITPCPLTDVTPLIRSAKGLVMSQFEKEQAEAIGLVKMDLLGNSGLSVIQEAGRWLAQDGQELAEPGPLFDYKVRRLFARGDTLGVYQCESPGMRQLCCALQPGSPPEVAAALSLIRPGPSAAGMKETFIRRRLGLEPVRYLHPKMATFLTGTYGVMLYQEDVMKLAVNLAGYTPADADGLRRAVSKARSPEALEPEHRRFVLERAAAAGLAAEEADAIWQLVARFASYSYCKAHAAVYGRLAWLTARLKAHHPREFYTAILNGHQSMYPLRVFVWDAIRHGIPVFPPDIQFSAAQWTPGRGGIRASLGLIRGLRTATLNQLLAEREHGHFRTLADLRRRVPFQAGELERLILAGACRGLGDREDLLAEVAGTGRDAKQLPLFSPVLGRLPSLLAAELWLTGVPFCRHPVEQPPAGTCRAAELGRFCGREVEVVGILDTWKPLRTTRGKGAGRNMAFVTLEDASGLIEVVLFPDEYARFGSLFSRLGPYRVRGRVEDKRGFLLVEASEIEVHHATDPVGPSDSLHNHGLAG